MKPEKYVCTMYEGKELSRREQDGMVRNKALEESEAYYEELLGGLKEDYINGTQEGVLVEVVLIAKELGWDDGEA